MAYRRKRKRKTLSTSKIALMAMMLVCLEIIIYAEVAMLKLGDLSALYVLIGIPAAMAATIWGYFSKTKVENSEGGIVYEQAMLEQKANLGLEFIDLEKGKDISVG